MTHGVEQTEAAYSISSVAETIDRAPSSLQEREFKRWFPVAFLANSVFVVTRAGFELTTPVLRVRKLNHHNTAPLE